MRLLVHVEGETEESFVKALLSRHLYGFGYTAVSARLLGNARQRSRRGGITAWSAVRKDIARHLRSDSGAAAALMVDYYALPASGQKTWPGRREAEKQPPQQRADYVEQKISDDLQAALPTLDPKRFLPCVVMHEFEALLFSDCDVFGAAIGRTDLSPKFQTIRDAFDTPEEIDDAPESAPSKRIERLFPAYQKPLFGTLAAQEIGLERIRTECPHFAGWIERLEGAIER